MFEYLEQKLLGRLQKSFLAVRNFKLQYDPFSNLKEVSQRSISKLVGHAKNGLFHFWIFSMTLGTSVDGQENVILHYKTFYFSKTCAET
jgi:hypothetical protein